MDLLAPSRSSPPANPKRPQLPEIRGRNRLLTAKLRSWLRFMRVGAGRVIDVIAVEYAGKLKCFVLNADVDSQIAEEYDIKAVPVVLLFKNGKKCDTVVGTMPKEFYVSAMERVLKP